MKARVRWLTNVAFQIDCCSKTVITDPCLEKTAYQGFHADSFVNVDYVVLSHVHWDHIYDLKAMVAKYSPKIFVGALSAYETALYCDSNPSYVYPMFPNQDVVVDGMNIKCIATRHLVLPSKAQSQVERGAKADFFPDRPGMGPMHMLGTLDMNCYLMTFDNGFTVLFAGGELTKDIFAKTKDLRPDLLLFQYSTDDEKRTVEFINNVNPVAMMPHHDDMKVLRSERLDRLVSLEKALGRKIDYPLNGQWIEF